MHQRALFEVKNRKNSQWTLPVCTGMYVQVCMYRYVYMYVRTCMYVCTCMYVHVCEHTYRYAHECMWLCTYRYESVQTQIAYFTWYCITHTHTQHRYISLHTSHYRQTDIYTHIQYIKRRYLARGSVTNHRRATM